MPAITKINGRYHCQICECQVSKRRIEDHETSANHINKLYAKVKEFVTHAAAEECIERVNNNDNISQHKMSTKEMLVDWPNEDPVETRENDACTTFHVRFGTSTRWSRSFAKQGIDWRVECNLKNASLLIFLIAESALDADLSIQARVAIPSANIKVTCTSQLATGTPYTQILKVNEKLSEFVFTLVLESVETNGVEIAPESFTTGRPKEYTRYKTASTRAINAWWHHWHGRPFTREALAELLDIISDPNFVPKEVAPSCHLLEKCDEFFFNSIPIQKMEFKAENGTQEVLQYHPPKEILKYILNDSKLMQGWHDKSSCDVDHPSSSLGWHVYESHHANLITKCDYKLVLGILWMDKFLGERSRNNSYTSVYITFANFSKEVSCSAESRFLVCTIPPSLSHHKREIVDKIIVDFFIKLEEASLPALKLNTMKQVSVCGGLHAIKGDHIEKISLGGIVAPTGHKSSFYTPRRRDEFSNIEAPVTLRSVEEVQRKLAKMEKLTIKEQKEEITATGLTLPKSPFWRLRIFAKDFFLRFGICSLHLLLLGIIKKYVEEVGLAKGAKYRNAINLALSQFKKWPRGCTPIPMKIYRLKKGTTMPLTGQMWFTFAHVSTVLNVKHLSKPELARWSVVMRGVLDIYRSQWDGNDLLSGGKLAKLIAKIQSHIIKSFPLSSTTNWHVPNFETLRVIPKLIEFLGPLWVQSTDIEEGLNKYSRQCLYVSNHKMGANSIIQMNAKRRGIVNQKFDSNSEEERQMLSNSLPWCSPTLDAPSADVPEFAPISATESIIDSIAKKDIDKLISSHFALDKATSFVLNDAFVWKNLEIERETLVSYSDGVTTRYGFISNIFDVTTVNGCEHLVIETREPYLSSQYPEIKEKVLNKGREASHLVPLTFGNFKLARLETAVPDPSNKQRLFVIS